VLGTRKTKLLGNERSVYLYKRCGSFTKCHDLCELATYFTNITGVMSLTPHLSFTWMCGLKSMYLRSRRWTHRRSQGGAKEPCLLKIFRKYSHLCFERRFSKQNSVIRLKSNILNPPKFLTTKFLAWLRHWVDIVSFASKSTYCSKGAPQSAYHFDWQGWQPRRCPLFYRFFYEFLWLRGLFL